jgi:glycosyltransferase involved in cell wall biosynthesis
MINVFICTYNPNHEYLLQTIESLLSQDIKPAEWDLTIIDNNSKEAVSEIGFIKKLKIKTIVEKTQGLTAARECATKHATGDILIFVDDDNILDADYLSVVNQLFSGDSELVILSGNIAPKYICQPARWFKNFESMLAIRILDGEQPIIYTTSPKFDFNFPIGAGMAVRTAFLREYYQYHLSANNYIEGRKGDELSSSEDIDLDLYAIYKGHKLGISPLMRVTHIIPEKRIQPEYILKLGVESIKSGYQVNAKWSHVFDSPIFEYFQISKTELKIKILLSSLLSFKKSFYIKRKIYEQLLKYK